MGQEAEVIVQQDSSGRLCHLSGQPPAAEVPGLGCVARRLMIRQVGCRSELPPRGAPLGASRVALSPDAPGHAMWPSPPLPAPPQAGLSYAAAGPAAHRSRAAPRPATSPSPRRRQLKSSIKRGRGMREWCLRWREQRPLGRLPPGQRGARDAQVEKRRIMCH